MARDRTRDVLFDEVRYGRLSPDEAEAGAERMGVGPLVRQPDATGFDPLREAHWTVVMSVAWIVWRAPEHVRDNWNEYRAKRKAWRHGQWRIGPDGEIHSGHALAPLSPANLSRLGMFEAYRRSCGEDTAGVPTVSSAVESLLEALRRGALRATGRERQSRSRTAISVDQWQDLELVECDDRDVARCERPGSNRHPWYEDLTLMSADVRALWPPMAPRDKGLPAPMPPVGGGYMPLACAAHWIVTSGGSVEISAEDERWPIAYAGLVAALAAGRLEVTGVSRDMRERIDGFHFADCRVVLPQMAVSPEPMLPDGLHLLSYPYIDDHHWRGGFDDSLRFGHAVRWSRLMVNKDHVASQWSFGTSEPLKTGVPGRPTSKHLVLRELERRARGGRLPSTLSAASRELADWLTTVHPKMPTMGPKGITNAIRVQYWKLTRPK